MAPRRQNTAIDLPIFDPNPSLKFGADVLQAAGVEHALIGRVAMWYWLANPADHEYTKDVHFAVPHSALPAILKQLHSLSIAVRPLSIGGVSAMKEEEGIRTDFVDRSSQEWGSLQPLYLDAIAAANQAEDGFANVPVAPSEHLVAMKVGAGTDKDERDAIRIIAKVESLDVEKMRELAKKFLGPSGIGRPEECLRRAGHPRARRAYTERS